MGNGYCMRLEGRSGGCILQRRLKVWLFVPCVKGYCRPDLPAHYREKFGFVLRRMVSDQRQKGGYLSQSEGLRGVDGVGNF
ncbi:hypothetical protein EMIT0357P_40566 [Pseudomonas marginalis]